MPTVKPLLLLLLLSCVLETVFCTSLLQDLREEVRKLNGKIDTIADGLEQISDSLREQESGPSSCQEVKRTNPYSGVRTIYVSGKAMQVYCDQTTDGGGWTMFQRRQVGDVAFNRSWSEYERGFGNLNGEFWLGLANIHLLTARTNVSLRIDLWDGTTHVYIVYRTFFIDGANNLYRLHLDTVLSGNAGDSMLSTGSSYNDLDKMAFSTFDRDNDLHSGNCAASRGAWWYNRCTYSNLNGYYGRSGSSAGVAWYKYKNDWRSFSRSEMKIRPRG